MKTSFKSSDNPVQGLPLTDHYRLKKKRKLLKQRLLFVAYIGVYQAYFLLLGFNYQNYGFFQFIAAFPGTPFKFILQVIVGIDAVSLMLITLTLALVPISFLASITNLTKLIDYFFGCLVFLASSLFLLFLILDFLFFYVLFEFALIPLFLVINNWGARLRRIRASLQFFLYTLAFSLLFLWGLLVVYISFSTAVLFSYITVVLQIFAELPLFFSMFSGLAVKVPLFPIHIWLPEAHAEAPTGGSILLAGIVLKLGFYAFFRFLLFLCPVATAIYRSCVFTISLTSLLFSSSTTLSLVDFKKTVAYSSISHMSYGLIGLFSGALEGIIGSLFMLLAHGLTSSGLFFKVGSIYDRYATRTVLYYGGIALIMPTFAGFFASSIFSNAGIPPFSNFIAEVLTLMGITSVSILTAFCTLFGMIASTIYSFLLFGRTMFGPLNTGYIIGFSDINLYETIGLLILNLTNALVGIVPNFLLLLLAAPAAYCLIINL